MIQLSEEDYRTTIGDPIYRDKPFIFSNFETNFSLEASYDSKKSWSIQIPEDATTYKFDIYSGVNGKGK